MRSIGQIDLESDARRFSDFLYVQRIPNEIERSSEGRWDVWVHSDDDLTQAAEWLNVFRKNPAHPQFDAVKQAEELRASAAAAQERFEKKLRTRGDLFRRFAAYGLGPITAILIAVCVYVFIYSKLGDDIQRVQKLLFSEHRAAHDLGQRLLGSSEIRSGEAWRLLTPMFLHFSIIHILFNMLWLRDLGGMIETLESGRRLAALVLVGAAISNWAEYVVAGHSLFGGMSGVVYALLGYVWMKGRFDPGSGLYLHPQTVIMMLIWLVVCFTGMLGPIANYAHLAGLVVGTVWGFAATHLGK